MRSSLLRGILNKDGPRQEPRRPFDKVIPISFGIIPPESFNRLPHNGLDGDTRIRHAGSTQACANHYSDWYPRTVQVVLTLHSFRSSFHPDLGSSLSLSHVDDAQESLRALQESADAFPNPYLKSAVNSVSALWQTAKVKQNVGFPRSSMIEPNFVLLGTVEGRSSRPVAALTQSSRNPS